MSKKLFVGNLPFDVNDADLKTVLSVAGTVASAQVIINRKSGRSKGYGFVEMETEAMAQAAVQQFEGATLNERLITVQLATPKQITDSKTDSTSADSKEEPQSAVAPVVTAPEENQTASQN
jgi:RNA recognition motif-containing protein